MKIIIVRHAQTDENVGGGLAMRTSEILLNEEGVRQAEKLGEHLKQYRISHAYSSPLQRAVDTAKKILQHHPSASMETVEQLSEQTLGVAETLPKHVWKEIKKNTKEAWHAFKPEKGESYAELQARVVEFFKGISERHSHEDTVLIVSHGGTLGVLLLDILGKELTQENYRAHQPKNTEFTVIEATVDGRPEILVLNGRQHLDE